MIIENRYPICKLTWFNSSETSSKRFCSLPSWLNDFTTRTPWRFSFAFAFTRSINPWIMPKRLPMFPMTSAETAPTKITMTTMIHHNLGIELTAKIKPPMNKIGIRSNGCNIIIKILWICCTSLVNRTTKLPAENCSTLPNENVWILRYAASRTSDAIPCDARAAKIVFTIPAIKPIPAITNNCNPIWRTLLILSSEIAWTILESNVGWNSIAIAMIITVMTASTKSSLYRLKYGFNKRIVSPPINKLFLSLVNHSNILFQFFVNLVNKKFKTMKKAQPMWCTSVAL